MKQSPNQANRPMDHLRKALEKAESNTPTVRDWMQPVAQNGGAASSHQDVKPGRVIEPDTVSQSVNRLIALSNENPAILDRYRLLRTRVQQALKAQNWRVLGITSSAPEAGKTLTTLNLGITIARADTQQVIIVDADLRKPSIAGTMGMSPEFGLADFLSGEAELTDIMYQPANCPNLTIVPAAGLKPPLNPSELLASSRFDNLVKMLRTTGAFVLVDTPPLLVGDDVLAIAPRLDCFLLVVEEGKTTVQELKDAARLLHDHHLIGSVLNKSSQVPQRFQSYYASSATGDIQETAR